MNKLIIPVLLSSILFISYRYNGSTTGAITLVGGIIKANQTENIKKYKRKDCPVCKGKGWYISGDDITKVPCGYCEPDSGSVESEIIHPPVILSEPPCKTRIIRK